MKLWSRPTTVLYVNGAETWDTRRPAKISQLPVKLAKLALFHRISLGFGSLTVAAPRRSSHEVIQTTKQGMHRMFVSSEDWTYIILAELLLYSIT